jgi:hypothetical protein
MKDLYENALIGEFILRLGYKMGDCGTLEHEDFSFNLLQQTPLDSLWGDYMARKNARGFVVEFKRDFAGRTTERDKLKYKLIQKSSRLQELAGKCQLFGYSKKDPNKRGKTNVFFCRYLEALSDKNKNEIEQWEMSKLLDDIVLNDKIGGTAEDFANYVTETLDSLKEYYNNIPEEDKEHRQNILAQIVAGDSAVAIITSEHAITTIPLTSMLPLDFIIRPKKRDEGEGSGDSDKSKDKFKSLKKSKDLSLGKEHGYGPPLGYDQFRDRGHEPPGHER